MRTKYMSPYQERALQIFCEVHGFEAGVEAARLFYNTDLEFGFALIEAKRREEMRHDITKRL